MSDTRSRPTPAKPAARTPAVRRRGAGPAAAAAPVPAEAHAPQAPRPKSSRAAESARARQAGVASEEPATRNREHTQARILRAVGEVLARDGFAAIGVNAIAREAGVDKVLIYRYFGGLPELLATWGTSGQFWPSVTELLGDDPQAFLALPAAERYAQFFEHFVDGLRARPLTIEILAAEVQQRNELAALLEAEREAWGEEAGRIVGGADFVDRPDLQGLTILLVAGVQYLLVRARQLRVFGGVAVQTDEGWAALKAAIRAMALRMLA